MGFAVPEVDADERDTGAVRLRQCQRPGDMG
jgi:hypothetical protein